MLFNLIANNNTVRVIPLNNSVLRVVQPGLMKNFKIEVILMGAIGSGQMVCPTSLGRTD